MMLLRTRKRRRNPATSNKSAHYTRFSRTLKRRNLKGCVLKSLPDAYKIAPVYFTLELGMKSISRTMAVLAAAVLLSLPAGARPKNAGGQNGATAEESGGGNA